MRFVDAICRAATPSRSSLPGAWPRPAQPLPLSVGVLQAVPEGSILRPMSQWRASAFRAVTSPASPERSRAVSLVTSFGSCGAT